MGWPLYVTKRGNALVPNSRAAQVALDKLKVGVHYKISPKQPRNTKQHRLFWAFATLVADALNDALRAALVSTRQEGAA